MFPLPGELASSEVAKDNLRAVPGKVPELPTFSALVRQPGVENSLGCCVSESGAFDHGWYPDDPGQLADILNLNRDHGPRRSLDVEIQGFYVKYIPDAAGHDGKRLLCAELDVKIQELHFEGVREEHFNSVLVGSEER
ncbi:unnamed protein product [Sphagnum tenellum]